jgi:hypothetical protein
MLENIQELIGSWTFANNKGVIDENCKMVNELLNKELQFISDDNSGWNKLYKYNIDSSYWELTYPQSDLHGGGPPALKKIKDLNELKNRYSISEL